MPHVRRDPLPRALALVALATLAGAFIVRPQPLPRGSAEFPVAQQVAPARPPRIAAPGVPVIGRSYAIDTVSAGNSSGTPAAPLAVPAGTDVHVEGWVVDPKTLEPVDYVVFRVDNGRAQRDFDCHLPRPDVAAALGAPDAAASGFEGDVETAGLRPGRHAIAFAAVTAAHRMVALPTVATIDVAGP